MMAAMSQGVVIIRLTPAEAQEILTIDLDEDAHQALWFIREKMASHISASIPRMCAKMAPVGKVKKCQPHCRESQEICCVNGRRRQAEMPALRGEPSLYG